MCWKISRLWDWGLVVSWPVHVDTALLEGGMGVQESHRKGLQIRN
jgi:hypothetical protein